MLRAASAALVVVLACASSSEAAERPRKLSQLEQELRRLNDESAAMQVRKDAASADRLLAEDYVFFRADGGVSNKAQNVAGIRDPAFVCESLVTDDVQVRLYGDAAVVTGRAVIKATSRGQALGGAFRYTDVWVKRRGRWQTVVSHATRLPEPR